jgi:hypothetical protein
MVATDSEKFASSRKDRTMNQTTKTLRIGISTSIGLLCGCVLPASAQVTGWGLDTGLANATLTEGIPGSFSTTTPTGNAGPRAVLSSPMDFSIVGESILLSGTVSFPNTLGNEQFRFGLFNNNGNALGTLSAGAWTGATTSGWLGYIVEPGNAGGTTALYGRNGSGANAWLSTSGSAYAINNNPTAADAVAGTYTFSLALVRTSASAVSISYDFGNLGSGGTYDTTGTFTDSGGLSSGMTSFNAVGFLLNANTGAGTFSGVTVGVAPEPSILSLGALGLAALGACIRRRKV